MTLAFKEWSYIVDALGKGMQSIILRKGGIAEDGGEFKIKNKKFILFPTLYHQAKDLIKEDWIEKLDGTRFHKEPNKVSLEYFAETADSRLISDWAILQKLYPQHAWKEMIVQERYNRWEKNVYLMIVQIYQLSSPVLLEINPEYEGCKSWIDMKEDIELTGSPVINKEIQGTYWKKI